MSRQTGLPAEAPGVDDDSADPEVEALTRTLAAAVSIQTPEHAFYTKRLPIKEWPYWQVCTVEVFAPLGCTHSVEIEWHEVDNPRNAFSESWPTKPWVSEEKDLAGLTWIDTWSIWKVKILSVRPCEVDVIWKLTSHTAQASFSVAAGERQGVRRRLT